MKVLVAGATGAIGRQLVPRLVERGHEVTGTTTSASKRATLTEMGATPVVVDLLDPEQVAAAVAESEPEAIVHEATALTGINPRKMKQSFEVTNRLRTEGIDHLLSAARATGVKRFVAQSFAGWPFARVGGAIKTEEDPLDTEPPRQVREITEAIRYLERAVTEADWTEGIVLRYGGFYGPGTSLAPGGEQYEPIRKRRFPIIGDGQGIWSLVHVADAAEATVLALERGKPGLYNIVDDDPAPVADVLEAVSEEMGVGKPRRVPRWVGRLAAGKAGVLMMTEVRGASNAKAKRELGWEPRHPSWHGNLVAGR